MHVSDERATEPTLSDAIRCLNRSTDHLRHAFADSRGIYHTDFRALLLIDSAQRAGTSLTAGELAAALELSSGAVTYLVERMAQANYVQREVDPMDRRKVLLVATTQGRRVVRDYLSPMDKLLDNATNEYGQEEVSRALTIMSRMAQELRSLTDSIRVADGKQPFTSPY